MDQLFVLQMPFWPNQNTEGIINSFALCLWHVRSVREAWIKAKYVDKAFVKQTTLPSTTETSAPAPVLLSARQWSVYKRKRKSTLNESASASITADTDSNSTKGYY